MHRNKMRFICFIYRVKIKHMMMTMMVMMFCFFCLSFEVFVLVLVLIVTSFICSYYFDYIICTPVLRERRGSPIGFSGSGIWLF